MKKVIHQNSNHNQGFTLIEALLYMALFVVIFSAAGLSAFYITASGQQLKTNLVFQEETGFILKKLDWVFMGVESVNDPPLSSSGSRLSLMRDGRLLEMRLNDGKMQIKIGEGDYEDLNNDLVLVSDLVFGNLPPVGVARQVKISFVVSDNYGRTQSYKVIKLLK
jgi:hypothetical protein